MVLLKCFLFATLLHHVLLLPEVIRIGGIFETGESDEEERAFRAAVKRFKVREDLLPGTTLIAEIRRVPRDNSFKAIREVCEMLNLGVAAIFGPQSRELSTVVSSTLFSLDVPHLEARRDLYKRRTSSSFNFYPDWGTVVQAYKDIIKAKQWEKFAILYEDNQALIRLEQLLQSATKRENKRVILRKLSYPYRDVLREIRSSDTTNILIDCHTKNLRNILKQAQQVGIMNDIHSYIITNLDFQTIDIEDFKHSHTNITGFRILNPDDPKVQAVMSTFVKNKRRRRYGTKPVMNTNTALIFDAVSTFADAIKRSDGIKKISFNPISCDVGASWSSGSLYNELQMSNITGLTGNINFDHVRRSRSNVRLEIVEVTSRGLMKAGTWSAAKGLGFNRELMSFDEAARFIKNKKLRITTYLNNPYVMEKESAKKLTGNDRYEGYCIDLVELISKKLDFKYEIHINVDNAPGKKDPATGKWNGMIGELINNQSDLAVGDLTITFEREQAVDFTMPFMNLGISILFKKPTASVPSLLSFLSPLSWRVWIYMLMAYVGVSLFMFIIARFSPYEWVSPHPCNQESDVLENQFSFANSLWFTIGSLMQQGSDLAPTAWSTRMIAATWWFFTLIMISSYTANLAAFLTVQKMVSPIESAEGLARQTKIKYGGFKGGSTENFFRYSITYKAMWDFMEANYDEVMVKSSAVGVERVLKGNYAYLMESTSIEYGTQRNCDLTQIGGLLDSKGYGIATPKNSPFRQLITSAILKLQEETVLDVLKVKWWTQKRAGRVCSTSEDKGSIGTALNLANVGGVFVVLLGGICISWIIGVTEFIWKTKRSSYGNKSSLCGEILKELKYALSCESSTRQVPKTENQLSMSEDGCKSYQYPEMVYHEAGS